MCRPQARGQSISVLKGQGCAIHRRTKTDEIRRFALESEGKWHNESSSTLFGIEQMTMDWSLFHGTYNVHGESARK